MVDTAASINRPDLESHGPAVVPSHAIIFRTHFWDEFVQRQFDRLLKYVGAGHVYILVDETNGVVHGINHDRVLRMTERDVLDMRFARSGTGNLLWFNGDYPLYLFLQNFDSYEYYVQLEYDVVLNTSIDALICQAAVDQADFVGLTKGEPVEEWQWLDTCRGFYDLASVKYKLICLSVYSSRALHALCKRRLEMSVQVRESATVNWPFCEGFIATEMSRGDFVSVELSRYLNTSAYDTWPPFVESDLVQMRHHPVIHPVLDPDRYVASLLKYKVGLIGYLNPFSLLHRKLRRLPIRTYLYTLLKSFGEKATRTLNGFRFRLLKA